MHYLHPRSLVRREPWERGWHYLQVVITTPEWGYEVILILRSLITDNPPCSIGKVGHTSRIYAPLACVAGAREGFRAPKFPFPCLSIPRTPATQAKPFVDVIAKAALSSKLVNDPECWSCRGLNTWPPAQQTGAFPTEVIRQLKNAVLIKGLFS